MLRRKKLYVLFRSELLIETYGRFLSELVFFSSNTLGFFRCKDVTCYFVQRK